MSNLKTVSSPLEKHSPAEASMEGMAVERLWHWHWSFWVEVARAQAAPGRFWKRGQGQIEP